MILKIFHKVNLWKSVYEVAKQNKFHKRFVAFGKLGFKEDLKKPYSNEHKLKLSSTLCVANDAQ